MDPTELKALGPSPAGATALLAFQGGDDDDDDDDSMTMTMMLMMMVVLLVVVTMKKMGVVFHFGENHEYGCHQ